LNSVLSRDELNAALPLSVKGKTVGYLLTEGGMALTQGDEAFLLSRLTRAALIAGLVSAALSLVLAWLLANNLARPVRLLTQATERMANGDLMQRVQVAGSDELAALGKSFNQMALSLQKSEEVRQAMTADIAHELRNPLAVQRANLEALQDGVYPLTREALNPILEQNLLLTRLVEDLRTLAQADAGQLKLELAPTDLPRLVERVVERFRPQAAQQAVELIVESDQLPAEFTSLYLDPMRVEQIMNNLLSNALRYSPAGGKIIISLERAEEQAQVHVRDAGPGIPVDALPHIFERFYRVDRSRSRSEGGSGLGLAIARQLAEAHGGTLTAANVVSGGAEFTLGFPLKRK